MNLKSKKIAVLMGGISGEREVSLRSGKRVFASLKKQGFKVVAIDPAKEVNLVNKLKKLKIDIVYIALHGKFGEDGIIQGLLDSANIPYTGSKVLASALAMNKLASKRIFQAMNIPTPCYEYVNKHNIKEILPKIENEFPVPLIVKPVSEGSSLGVTLVKNQKKIKSVIAGTVKKFGEVLVEDFIKGTEVTVGVLGGPKDLQALPILELIPKNEFYDYAAKYTEGMTKFILPARLPEALYKYVQKVAISAHKALGCHGVSRVDFIVSKDNIPYVNEINTIPGMTDRSDLPAEAAAAGISFDQLVLKILESAL